MKKLLVAAFSSETAADAGLNALRALNAAGDITLYAAGVLARDAQDAFRVKKSMDTGPTATATGLAVGSLDGLLGGPAGMASGAATGTVVGAVSGFWVAGVGLHFIDEVTRHLQPVKVALVAEVDEAWVIRLDLALEAAGGHVFRRTGSEVAQAQFDRDFVAFKAKIKEIESEASHDSGAIKTKQQAKFATAKTHLDGAVHRAQQRVNTLKQEADAKVESLKLQPGQTKGDVRARIEERMKRVKSACHARGAQPAQAWNLTREALTA